MSLITLSMPVYNVEKYVERALLSALDQTYQSLEILVVDDLGQDNSMDIVFRVKAQHARGHCIRVITHENNIGLGGTRNTAISQAKGEYLYFMDSDDVIEPDCIERLYAVISTEKVDFVAAGINKVDSNYNSMRIIAYPNLVSRGDLCMAQYLYVKKNIIWMTTWNKLYDIRFLREFHIHALEHVYHEDEPIHALIALKARSFALISNITYFHFCTREDSIMNRGCTYTSKHLNDLVVILGEINRMINSDHKIYVKIRKAMNSYYLSRIYSESLGILYADIDEELKKNTFSRLLKECTSSIWNNRFTPLSIYQMIFLRLPIKAKYEIEKWISVLHH